MSKNKKHYLLLFLLIISSIGYGETNPSDTIKKRKYKTERLIILVVDGPRYSETWGDSSHRYIPHLYKEMSKSGVVCTDFFNDGYTYTTSGHTAICSGVRQELENYKGTQLPDHPSIFQCYLKTSNVPASKAWIVTSKDKLFILGNCNDPTWKDQYIASTDCGNNGPGSGYREDSITFKKVMNVLTTQQPNLMLVNFREPDYSGHANNWPNYLKGIVDTDSLTWEIWKFIQTDPYYKNKTSLIITNDHGRHLDGWKDGFVSHGDSCEGCKHINFFAFGPDFKKNVIVNQHYTQVDMTATIAQLMGLSMPKGQGRLMKKIVR